MTDKDGSSSLQLELIKTQTAMIEMLSKRLENLENRPSVNSKQASEDLANDEPEFGGSLTVTTTLASNEREAMLMKGLSAGEAILLAKKMRVLKKAIPAYSPFDE